MLLEYSKGRTIYGPIKKELKYKNKYGLQDTLQGPGIVKLLNNLN